MMDHKRKAKPLSQERRRDMAWTILRYGVAGFYVFVDDSGTIKVRRYGDPDYCESLRDIVDKLDMDDVPENDEAVLDYRDGE